MITISQVKSRSKNRWKPGGLVANAVQRILFTQNSGVLTLTLDTLDTKLSFDETVTVGSWIVLGKIYIYGYTYGPSWNHGNIVTARITMWWTSAAANGFTAKSTFTLPPNTFMSRLWGVVLFLYTLPIYFWRSRFTSVP